MTRRQRKVSAQKKEEKTAPPPAAVKSTAVPPSIVRIEANSLSERDRMVRSILCAEYDSPNSAAAAAAATTDDDSGGSDSSGDDTTRTQTLTQSTTFAAAIRSLHIPPEVVAIINRYAACYSVVIVAGTLSLTEHAQAATALGAARTRAGRINHPPPPPLADGVAAPAPAAETAPAVATAPPFDIPRSMANALTHSQLACWYIPPLPPPPLASAAPATNRSASGGGGGALAEAKAESRRRFSTHLPPARLFALSHNRILVVTTQNTLEVWEVDTTQPPAPAAYGASNSAPRAGPITRFVGGSRAFSNLSAVAVFPGSDRFAIAQSHSFVAVFPSIHELVRKPAGEAIDATPKPSTLDFKHTAGASASATATVPASPVLQERWKAECEFHVPVSAGVVRSLCAMSDGDRIVTGNEDGTIRVWSCRAIAAHYAALAACATPHEQSGGDISPPCLAVFRAHKSGVRVIVSCRRSAPKTGSGSGGGEPMEVIASAGLEGPILLWSLPSAGSSTSADGSSGGGAQQLSVLGAGHRESIRCLYFSSNWNLLFSGSDDTTVKLTAVDTGIEINSFHLGGSILKISELPDGRILIIATAPSPSNAVATAAFGAAAASGALSQSLAQWQRSRTTNCVLWCLHPASKRLTKWNEHAWQYSMAVLPDCFIG